VQRSPSRRGAALKGAVAGVFAAMAAVIAWLLGRPQPVAHALIVSAPDHTVYDPECGVRSVQAADLILPSEALDAIWDPMHLERLARTYWRWLSRATLGIVQVDYQAHGRQVKALGLVPLLTFKEPEYEMSADRGIVRWRIERGVLVAKAGRGGAGYLEIDVKRQPSKDYPGQSICHVEVEVANFYPAIASTISRWVYENTQSRIHVLVTHGFLRGLARLDLAESKAKRFAAIEDLPDPVPARDQPTRGAPSRSAA
jgi:hypothetical protein